MLNFLAGLVLLAAPPSVASLQAEVTRLKAELAACKGLPEAASKQPPEPSKLVEEDPPAFRFKDLTWGMSFAAAQKLRPKGQLQKSGEILTHESVAGLDAILILGFVDGGLAELTALFNETHSDDSAYMVDFDRMKLLLIQKYGPPAVDEPWWKNDLYRSDPAKWGFAVAAGHYAHKVTWDLPDTKLNLMIRGDNFKVLMGMNYVGTKYTAALKARREKERLEGL